MQEDTEACNARWLGWSGRLGLLSQWLSTPEDQFDTRRLADRLNGTQIHTVFTADDRALIENRTNVFSGDCGCRRPAGLLL
jgi:hypothetical protein